MKKNANKEIVLAETPSELRKRNAKRMPIGYTKSAILLFIATKGEADSVDLKWHLKEQYGIKNKKSLRIHLSDLIGNGLVAKRSNGKGLPDTYYLTSNFSTLKGVFNYLKANGREKELLTTDYFKRYVGSEDFKAKFFVQLTKSILISMVTYIQSDAGYNEQIKNFDKHGEFITAIKNSRDIKPKYKRLDDFDKALDIYNPEKVETLSPMVANVTSIINNTDVDSLYLFASSFGDWATPFMQKIPYLIIPDKEMPEFLAMLKASPSATDFMLNLDNDKALGLMSTLMRFVMRSVKDDSNKVTEFNTLVKDTGKFKDNVPKIYALLSDFSKFFICSLYPASD